MAVATVESMNESYFYILAFVLTLIDTSTGGNSTLIVSIAESGFRRLLSEYWQVVLFLFVEASLILYKEVQTQNYIPC